MMINDFRLAALAIALLGVASLSASDAPSVTSSGSAEVKRLPNILRVSVQIRVEGKDVRDALAKLKARQTAVRTAVERLKADAASIAFTSAAEVAPADSNRARMEMMRARMAQRGKRNAKKEQPKPVVLLGTTLTAEWPIKETDAEDLLISGKALEDDVKAADLGGLKAAEAKAKSDEDEETREEDEMMRMSMQTSNDGEAKPGEPMFQYCCKIPDDVRAKLLAEAFGKAKVDAERLAKAAGRDLGALRSLSASNVGGGEYDHAYQTQQFYRMMQGSRDGRGNDADGPAEAVGLRPAPVVYRVTVGAAFELK
jgi:uncharacterized protein YggE